MHKYVRCAQTPPIRKSWKHHWDGRRPSRSTAGPCTPLATLETLGGKIITFSCSSKEIAGLKKKKKNYYDDTKFVNSRLTVFSCGELTAGMNLLGICIARDGQKRCFWRGVLKA